MSKASITKIWTRYNADGTIQHYGRIAMDYNQAGDHLGVNGVSEIEINQRFLVGNTRQRSLIYFPEDPDFKLPINHSINTLMVQGMSAKNYNRNYFNTWGWFGFRGDIIVGTNKQVE